jgi:hypothetical protein
LTGFPHHFYGPAPAFLIFSAPRNSAFLIFSAPRSLDFLILIEASPLALRAAAVAAGPGLQNVNRC